MLNRQEKINACQNFFDSLSMILWGTHSRMDSCNRDISAYLVPEGTQNEVAYYSKPAKSFRFSDHWNWYANLKKCSDEDYIQCHSVDLPAPTERLNVGKASNPVFGIQVAVIGDDGNYHVVFGDRYDKTANEWTWVENDPMAIAALV